MDVVKEVLGKTSAQNGVYKSTQVDKVVELDVGGLLCADSNPLDPRKLRTSLDSYLLDLTRDNIQLLFNSIWELPTERVEDAVVAKLPKQKFLLPRFKPVPRPRQLTKWQQFAKDKGIVKKKKSKLSWDEELKKWIPLYGFKRADAQKEKDWVLEVPQNAPANEDQFAKKAEIKSEKVAKNELQRLRNIAKAKNVKIPRFGVNNPDVASAKELKVAVTVAKSSTASLGKFQPKLPHEKDAKGISAITPGASRKRKLAPVSAAVEKETNLSVIDSVLNKRPKINLENAASKQIHQKQSQSNDEERSERPMKRARRSAPSKPQKSKKPKNPNRPRKGKISGGRKRR